MASWREDGAGVEQRLVRAVKSCGRPLRGESGDYSRLLEAIGERPIVLLGAATEGTHEFYRERMALTQRLVVQKGFKTLAVEAGWSDAYRVNRYIHSVGFDRDAEGAMADFKRFPSWPWQNSDVLDLVAWMRQYNDCAWREEAKLSFLGLDLYSLRAAMAVAERSLALRDPEVAERARGSFCGFDQFAPEPRRFGRPDALRLPRALEREALQELLELHRRGLVRHAILNSDDGFLIEQSARLVEQALPYYRSLLRGRSQAWNAYEAHLASTMEELLGSLRKRGAGKIVVWAMSAHTGDASATSLSRRGRRSLGQLLRERLGDAVFSIGLTTYGGSVTAAPEWGRLPERMRLSPAQPGSLEDVFHQSGLGDFLLLPSEAGAAQELLARKRLERAVGVVYRPAQELCAHCFEARLAGQFDAVLHFDQTRAVEPLERKTVWESTEGLGAGL